MKTPLKFSVFLNFGLMGALLLLLARAHYVVSEPRERVSPSAVAPATLGAANSAQTAFNWAELESSDYPTFIKNLHAIGCPEQTVRDIITADVHGLYKQRRDRLKQDFVRANSEGKPPGLLERKSQELRSEEDSLIAILLGPEAALNEFRVENPLPARLGRDNSKPTPISMPLVFQNVDPKSLNLNPSQVEAITELREQFLSEIGGPNQDPNDPGYRERWQQSQPHIDEMLRGIIGINAFQDYQVAGWSEPVGENLTAGSHTSGQDRARDKTTSPFSN